MGSTVQVSVNQVLATCTYVLVRVHTSNLSSVQKEETKVRKRLNLLCEVEWQSKEKSGASPGRLGLDRRAAHPGDEGGGRSACLSERGINPLSPPITTRDDVAILNTNIFESSNMCIEADFCFPPQS